MVLRRVVTGHTDTGVSTVMSDGPIRRHKSLSVLPEMSTALVWSTTPGGTSAREGTDPTGEVENFVPEVGGTRVLVLTVPPANRLADVDWADPDIIAERREMSPGLVDFFDPARQGMHCTPTIDFGFVISGQVWLELDDGSLTHLVAGDIVVQNATWHAWRNTSDEICTMAFVLIGVETTNRPTKSDLDTEL